MSIQWTLVAGFLYMEVGLIGLMILPIISAKTWSKFFNSKFLKGVANQSSFYFNVLLLILVLLLCDAIREIYKYNKEHDEQSVQAHLDQHLQVQMRLFRAQRNFYISGFALFLWIVLRKIVTLIVKQSALSASIDAAMKQAANASETASKLMEQSEGKLTKDGKSSIEYEEKIKDLKECLALAEKEAEKCKKDAAVMKKQAEAVNDEYDRLMKEHEKLQQQLETAGDKKKE